MVNFLQKIQKWQNVPNMKTKIFNIPSIVLATYEKPNSEIEQFSHFWWLKPWKIIQFQFLKFLFGKNWAVKKGLLQIKMPQLLSTCHRFLPDWAWGFLGAENNFLQISRVTYSNINKPSIIVWTWLGYQRVQEVFHFWFCMLFIDRGC